MVSRLGLGMGELVSDPWHHPRRMLIESLGADRRDDAVTLWRDVGLTRPWNDPAGDFVRATGSPCSAVLGGTEDGRLVATVMVGHDGHRGWVYYLAVDPDERGQRRGHAMMEAAEAWLRQRDVPKLNLMIRTDNRSVEAFYRAIGYAADEVVVYSRRLTADAG
jgi:GNAT superfamily N-acetyltransferase